MFFNKAKDIVSKNDQWINSEPLDLKKLKGKVVLLDFWTYSCVNCLRTIPHLKEIAAKYDGEAVVIGIHTPEFEFEKDLDNVKEAIDKLGIFYPVLNDPERINWNNYGNMYWPRAAVIDQNGNKVMDHVGESGYMEIDEKIASLLNKTHEPIRERMKLYKREMSRETYGGSRRNNEIGSPKVCSKSGCQSFVDPSKDQKGVIYPDGEWVQDREYMEFNGDKGHIRYLFYAREINVVMEGQGIAEVLLNNQPLTEENSGEDIYFDNGRSYVKIDFADMYNLFKVSKYEEGEIKIIPFKGLRVYAYTFG